MIKICCDEKGFFNIEVEINGERKELKVKPYHSLLDALRNAGYKGTKKGCDNGECGSCAVIMDGKSVLSCVIPAVMAHGRKITTIEGIGDVSNPHPLQKAFVEVGAVQCGFCIPGMIISSKYLLDRNPNPSDEDIKHHLDGNLCRCSGYVKQIKAVKRAAMMMKKIKKSRR